jgi:Domain of unknown function DUF11
MRAEMKKVSIMSFIVMLLSLSFALPASAALFYTGGISIDSLSATIDVTTKAEITVEYELVNHGDSSESVTLTFSPSNATAQLDGSALSNPVSFDKGQKRTLALSYSDNLPTTAYQSILFSPMLFFDDMANSQRAKSYNVKLILPQGINRITYSSTAYDDASTQNGRQVFIWNKTDIYPSPLSIAWTMLDVNIAATKTANPNSIITAGEIIEVSVAVQNHGAAEIGNITLKDNFYPGAFEAIAPLDEFELTQPEQQFSDPHLYWTKEIGSLASGETKTYTYSVKVKTLGLETRLEPLVVSVNGTPVAVSNDVVLASELEGKYGPQSSKFPIVYLVVAVVVVAAIIASVFIIRVRKKKTA